MDSVGAVIKREALAPADRQKFTYGNIELGPDEVRILLLLPKYSEADGSDVHCFLARYDLKVTKTLDHQKHLFAALSYVWGDSQPQKMILINGKEKTINPELHDALLHIRSPISPVPLWVDAICINQDDYDERSREVRKMKRIYAECELVIFWLGVPDESDGFRPQWGISAAAAFAEFGKVYDELCERGEENEHDPFRIWESIQHHQPALRMRFAEMRFAEMLSSLFRLPFWQRVWTAQEFVLAEAGFFVWGSHSCNMNILEALAQIQDRVQPRSPFEIDFGSSIKSFMIAMGAVAMRSKQVSLMEALVNVRYRFANVGHDYIYGMLGVTDVPGIEPDYRKTEKDVSLDAFKMVLSQETNLDILSACDRGWAKCAGSDGRPDHVHWPTWLPDWSYGPAKTLGNEYKFQPRSLLFDLQEHLPLAFSAGADSEKAAYIFEDDVRLCVKGVEFDAVEQTIGSPGEDWKRRVRGLWDDRKLHPIYGTLSSLRKTCIKTQLYGRHRSLISKDPDAVLGRPGREWPLASSILTFFMQKMRSQTRRISEATNIIDSHLFDAEVEESDTEDKPPAIGLVAAMHLENSDSTFFITRRGLLGRGPISTTAGDKVCIFLGAKIPYLLRPNKDSEHYELAGEVYIHGVMKGAAMMAMKDQQRDFILV